MVVEACTEVSRSVDVGYFLEHIGQERFLVALVERVARETGLPPDQVNHEVRNATGGRGKAMDELRRFLRDVRREREQPFTLLVVAIDGDCQGYSKLRKGVQTLVKRSGYPGSVVCAVPDPHIERWYLEDTRALQQVLKSQVTPQPPPYKCERDRYKQALGQVIADAGVPVLLDGAEYGEEIAHRLDFYAVGKADAAFKHFVDGLREAFSPFVIAQGESD